MIELFENITFPDLFIANRYFKGTVNYSNYIKVNKCKFPLV